ncbi:MAG: 4-hydroxy-3-methylbut-2-enyl diphosphate reductase [bacterium]|nr:4-hydroxy-3-methylbut-2-enyl diphosphate reductase [bacterium]
MEVILATKAGFCFGVKRAIKLTYEALTKKENVYTLGPLIHNPQMVRKLEEDGVRVIDDLRDVRGGILVLRSHGVSPLVYKQAEERGLEVIDATCPRVRTVQDLASRLKEDGYQLIIVGERDHPEVMSIMERVEGDAKVIGEIEEVCKIDFKRNVGVIGQTTQDLSLYKDIIGRILEEVQEIRVYNTICEETIKHQAASLELAKMVDVIFVVGGRDSANTKRLVSVCRKAGVGTYHIEYPEEINGIETSVRKVGVAAGTSTPPWVINEVVNKLRQL